MSVAFFRLTAPRDPGNPSAAVTDRGSNPDHTRANTILPDYYNRPPLSFGFNKYVENIRKNPTMQFNNRNVGKPATLVSI